VAIVFYGVAIARLGPTRSAALTALIPVVAAILAILLAEIPGAATMLGIAAVTTGVMLPAGVLWRVAAFSQGKAPYAPHESPWSSQTVERIIVPLHVFRLTDV
jgi:hypothetical protein